MQFLWDLDLCILFPQGFALNFHHSKKHLGDASLAQSMHFLKGEGEGGHEGGLVSMAGSFQILLST